MKCRTISIRIFSYTKSIDDLKDFVVSLIKDFNVCLLLRSLCSLDRNSWRTRSIKASSISSPRSTSWTTRTRCCTINSSTSRRARSTISSLSRRRISDADSISFWRTKVGTRYVHWELFWFASHAQKRGVPYTLGFLFYGPPGACSEWFDFRLSLTIRYWKDFHYQGHCELHEAPSRWGMLAALIVFLLLTLKISLSRVKTYKDLQKVFHDTMFCEKDIPHHKMIYLLEGIFGDCLVSIHR